MKEIPIVQCLRGIAASAVAFFHFIYFTTDYIETQSIRDISFYGSLGIQVFFVISGVVIPNSMMKEGYTMPNWSRFMLKRIIRIEPPYLISILVALLYFQIRNYIPSSAKVDMMPGMRDLLLHIGYFIPFVEGSAWTLGTYWTLGVEFQYYLFLSFFLILALDYDAIGRIVFYSLFLVLPPFFSNDQLFPFHAPVFLIGIAYAFFINKRIGAAEYSCVTLAACTAAFFKLPISHLIAGFSTILIIHFLSSYSNRILRFIGTISYSIYLLHLSIGAAFVNFFSHRFRGDIEKPCVIVAGYLVTVGASFLFYKVVEGPSKAWSKRVKYIATEDRNEKIT